MVLNFWCKMRCWLVLGSSMIIWCFPVFEGAERLEIDRWCKRQQVSLMGLQHRWCWGSIIHQSYILLSPQVWLWQEHEHESWTSCPLGALIHCIGDGSNGIETLWWLQDNYWMDYNVAELRVLELDYSCWRTKHSVFSSIPLVANIFTGSITILLMGFQKMHWSCPMVICLFKNL